MSCHTDGDINSTVSRFGGRNVTNHCAARIPGDADRAKILLYDVYPALEYDNANINEKPRGAVMYPSTVVDTTTGRGGSPSYYNPDPSFSLDSSANCGKDSKAISGANLVFDYRPGSLSFNVMESDTWFIYLYDMGADGGTVGTPCYRIETQTRSGTPAGQTVPPGGTATTIEESSTRCIPCESFFCTPTESFCSYTVPSGDETGDPDAPYPLIYGIGTNSNKVVFTYNQLSTELPNGVNDLNFVYAPDNIDQDVWNDATYTGDPIVTTQNPWILAEDETFEVIKIYEGAVFESGNKQDLKIKVKIKPEIDFSQTPAVITGTRWELMELMQRGLNYAVNDTFTLEYVHTHDDASTDTISITLKISGVGPYSTVSSQEGFDILRAGDTINGHVITATFHTDLENFQHHVLYLDGDGDDFAKDTQYTSDRDHIITVVSGFGIPDRACLIGLYEFFDKSIQFTTYSVDPGSPDIYNTVIQPQITANIVNGTLDSVTIVDGGAGMDKTGTDIELVVVPPPIQSGKQAKVKGIFTAGVLTSVDIISRGSGYTTSDPPGIYVQGLYKTEIIQLGEDLPESEQNYERYLEQARNVGEYSTTIDEYLNSDAGKLSEEQRKDSYIGKTVEVPVNNGDLLTDPDARRRDPLPQRLYKKEKVDALRATYDDYAMKMPPDAPASKEDQEAFNNIAVQLNKDMDTGFNAITQKQVPDFAVYDATLIETTMRRFVELPRASTYTKYLINQYRADGNSETSINVTIGCNVAESGCDHLYDPTADPPVNLCPPPAGSSATTNDEEETYEDENGVEQTETVTYSYSYSITPMLGPGCENWSASGSMRILNNLTKAANTYAAAVNAFGNPFDV